MKSTKVLTSIEITPAMRRSFRRAVEHVMNSWKEEEAIERKCRYGADALEDLPAYINNAAFDCVEARKPARALSNDEIDRYLTADSLWRKHRKKVAGKYLM